MMSRAAIPSQAIQEISAPMSDIFFTPKVAADMIESWSRTCRRLRAELGEDIFSSWFGRLELDAVLEGAAHLSVPTRFLKSWIESHYHDRILQVFAAEAADIKRLFVSVRTSSRYSALREVPNPTLIPQSPVPAGVVAVPTESARAPAAVARRAFRSPPDHEVTESASTLSGSPLDRRLTFASFLVGKSNQLAHAAALRVALAPLNEAPLYNPLYIHSQVGLGKTHLLQALAHAASENGRRVIYLTAEKFMYGFVSALKAQNAIAFKEHIRAIDMLVIDDLQFLQGKTIQQEFCHTINALIDAGRPIIVAADRPPTDLECLEERVRSRLAGGLCLEMGTLDEQLRVKILQMRIAAAKTLHPAFEVSEQVLAYVAQVITHNGRDLDGAINRLLAHTTLMNGTLTIEMAEVAVRDLIRTRDPKRVKIEDIQKLVAGRYNVSRADILSSRRTAVVVRPRQIAMYLAKMLTLRSLPEIGRRFGGRDHTTVLHAVRKIEGLAQTDGTLSEEIELLKRMLQD